MRKIEEEMLQAIKERRTWAKDNTRVEFARGENGATWWCDVYLHGNHIAKFDEMTWRPTVNVNTLARWPTVTTKSRLRALGANIVTKRGTVYLNGEAI